MNKDEFTTMFKGVTGKELTKDFSPKELAELLNKHPPLRKAFREAVEECKPTDEEAAAAGLGQLFGDK